MAANYYEVLNISKDADSKAISDAYKKLALQWHPDKNPDNIDEANKRFKQISQAYQILSDSTNRLRYDRSQKMDGRYDDDSFDSDDDEFESFYNFVRPEMLFRHFFRRNESNFFPFFWAHDMDDDRNGGRRQQRNNAAEARRQQSDKAAEARRQEMRRENLAQKSCHIRTVNGKQWKTKTYYEDGNKIVERYEDGELISKQINGVPQKI